MAQADTSDWIEWTGGECPVDSASYVNWRIVDRNDDDDQMSSQAGSLDWRWVEGDEGNIIAYRVVQP